MFTSRLRKLKAGDHTTRASLDLGRLVDREERLLDTLSRGVGDTGDNKSSDGSSDTTSDGGSGQPPANIEIDISSMESNSEVIIRYRDMAKMQPCQLTANVTNYQNHKA